MTSQISDTFLYKGENYCLIGITGGNLASPEQFGMVPTMINTSCYRGFYATYELTKKILYLRKLTLRDENENYPFIRGVQPDKQGYQTVYHSLSEVIPFTGKLRLAKDFIAELLVNMGYQKPTAFKTVLDITLKDGHIIETIDRSEDMEKKRGAFKKHYESGDIFQTTAEAFNLDMDLE